MNFEIELHDALKEISEEIKDYSFIESLYCCKECSKREGIIHIKPECHPGSPMFATYDQEILILNCAECNKKAGQVWVAFRRDVAEDLLHARGIDIDLKEFLNAMKESM